MISLTQTTAANVPYCKRYKDLIIIEVKHGRDTSNMTSLLSGVFVVNKQYETRAHC